MSRLLAVIPRMLAAMGVEEGDPLRAAVEMEIAFLEQLRAMIGGSGAGEEAQAVVTATTTTIDGAKRRLDAGTRWIPSGAPLVATTPMDMSEHRSSDDVASLRFGGPSTVILEYRNCIVTFPFAGVDAAVAVASFGTRLVGMHDGRALVVGDAAGAVHDASDLAREANRALALAGFEVDEEAGAKELEEAVALSEMLFAFDLDTGAWTRPTRAEWPLAFVGHDGLSAVLKREDGATARLFTIAESAVMSPDLKWAWTDDRIYDTKLATVVAELRGSRDALALARARDGAFVFVGWFDETWAVVRDGVLLFELPEEPKAASFDEHAEHLATVDESGKLTVMRVAPDAPIVAQVDVATIGRREPL